MNSIGLAKQRFQMKQRGNYTVDNPLSLQGIKKIWGFRGMTKFDRKVKHVTTNHLMMFFSKKNFS
jgi:hypothetical protein